MISNESNTAVIEIGPLKISFPMGLEPEIAAAAIPAISLPTVGEYWEGQGGIYAGAMRGDGQSGTYHLIASVNEATDLAWGGYNVNESEALSRWDGLENTRALVESAVDHPAAEWASIYKKDGHDDFYLPAQRELNLCYATIADKFGPSWYWSSTQTSAYGAWFQLFTNGYQLALNELTKGRVRAVRRVKI